MDKGIVPSRRFSDRSKWYNLGIRSLIVNGLGPRNELVLRDSLVALVNQSRIGPLN